MRECTLTAVSTDEDVDSDSSDNSDTAPNDECYGGDAQMELPLSDQLPLFRF